MDINPHTKFQVATIIGTLKSTSYKSLYLASSCYNDRNLVIYLLQDKKKTLFFYIDLCDLDLDLGAIDLSLVHETLSYDGTHFCKVISKSIKE